MTDCNSVLIVGAGPTGLVLAIELARRGIRAHVVDKASEPSRASRAKGLQPRTLELFHRLGLVDAVLAGGGQFPRWRSYAGTSLLWERSVFDMLGKGEPVAAPGTPYPQTWMVAQSRTEAVLRGHLAKLGVSVEFGVEFLGCEQGRDGVVASLRNSAGSTRSDYRYVIGADGGSSAVRKALAIPFVGETRDDERFIIADVEATELDHGYWHNWSLDGDSTLRISMCPLPETGYFQLVAPIVPGAAAPYLTLGTLQELLEARSGRRDISLKSLTWITLHRTNLRLAARYRDGSVFLAGDAAHSPPQAGGQGLNISVQDAANLGWKLAAVIDGAPHALLESYEAERRPFAAGKLGVLAEALPSGSDRDEKAVEQRQAEIKSDIFHLALHYRDSPIVRELRGHPRNVLAGDRAPDALVVDGVGRAVRLFDLCRDPRWTLVAFAPTSVVECADVLNDYKASVQPCLAAPADSQALASSAHEIYRVPAGDATVLLIRPDGYIGFAANNELRNELRKYLTDILGPRWLKP